MLVRAGLLLRRGGRPSKRIVSWIAILVVAAVVNSGAVGRGNRRRSGSLRGVRRARRIRLAGGGRGDGVHRRAGAGRAQRRVDDANALFLTDRLGMLVTSSAGLLVLGAMAQFPFRTVAVPTEGGSSPRLPARGTGAMRNRRSSTPTRAPSSQALTSPAYSVRRESGSAWTQEAEPWTTLQLSASGGP